MAYLTAEEEFELQYADDLDVLSELENTHSYLSEESDRLNGTNKIQINKNIKSSTADEYKQDEEKKSTEKKGTEHFEKANEEYVIIDKECSSSRQTKRDILSVDLDMDYSAAKRFKSDISSSLQPLNTSSRQQAFCLEERIPDTSLCVTQFDGSTVYLSYLKDSTEIEDSPCSKHSTGLAQVSIESLKQKILENLDIPDVGHQPNEDISVSKKTTELWVEKHRPKSFVQLLSDEGVNRALLRWLKHWDKVVFGKEVVMKQRTETNIKKRYEQRFFKPVNKVQEELDEHNRPMQKIVLLCGPPGMGKTTLAGVIALAAGYNPIEMNASDDRSLDIFRKSLEAATQMKAVLDKSRRPNCLIIDEIDGAPAPSINHLIAFTKSPGTSKGKKKKGDLPLLLRPIICICNDQYATALKPLRRIALILNFPPTSRNRLASRMLEVSSFEGFDIDITALLLLCDKVNNDIRSCLSTIQFLFNSKKEKISAADVRKLEIGVKDVNKSLFTVWQEIFHSPKPKQLTDILGTIQNFGDYDKIFPGIFENYLKLTSKTSRMANFSKCIDWLCLADIFQREIHQHQNFILMRYIPFAGAAFNTLLASTSRPYLSYPSPYYECISKRSQSSNCLTSFRQELISSLRSFFNNNCLVVEMLPMLTEIIKPTLRCINPDLYTARERSELKRVVEVMISTNLNYVQERCFDGNYKYTIDPNIEEIVQFPLSVQKRQLEYTVKMLIAREIGIEKMRRCETVAGIFEKSEVKVVNEKKKVSNPKPVSRAKPIMEFFERKIEERKEVTKVHTTEESKDVDTVWYHFKEGYNNAIRKSVYMKDLM